MNNKSLRKMKSDLKAVSPVIATILLVLVAVASAVAFYAVTNLWQNEQSKKLQNVDINDLSGELKIAGSTTVQPFVDYAAPLFEKEHPGVKVSVSGGGSDFGISAIGKQDIQIGTISKAWDSSNPAVKATTIGYDGVIVATAHSISAARLGNLTTAIIQGVYGYNNAGTWVAANITAWNQFEYILDNPTSWTTVPTAAAGQDIVTLERSEGSGTEEGFTDKFLKSKNLLDGHADKAVFGNDGIVAALKADKNAIGFTSYGYKEGLSVFAFNGVACTDATIKGTSEGTLTGAAAYAGARPLVILTYGEPAANSLTAAFIDYITNVDNNRAFNQAVGFVPAL